RWARTQPAGRMPDPGRGSIPVGQIAVVSQVGVFARSVEDAALGLGIAARSDGVPPLRDFRAVDVSKLRIGFFADDGVFAPSAAYQRAVAEAADALRRRGVQVVELRSPEQREGFQLFYRLLSADRMAGLRRFLGDAPRVKQISQLEQGAGVPGPVLPLLKASPGLSGRHKIVEGIGDFGRR